MPNFGVFGYSALPDHKRVAYIRLNDKFLHNSRLQYHQAMEDVESQITLVFSPTTKPSIPTMANGAKLDRQSFLSTL